MKTITATALALCLLSPHAHAGERVLTYGPYVGQQYANCNSTPLAQGAPIALIVHGGWDTQGSRNAAPVQQVCHAFAQAGWLAVTMDYRLGVPWPSAWQDVQLAARALRGATGANTPVVLVGLSAGGYNVLGAGMQNGRISWTPTDPLGEAKLWDEQRDRPDAIISITGFADLNDSALAAHAVDVLAGSSVAMRALASPTSLVRSDVPPTLLVVGTRDTVVAPAQSEQLLAMLQSAQAPVAIMRYAGGHVLGGMDAAGRGALLGRVVKWAKRVVGRGA